MKKLAIATTVIAATLSASAVAYQSGDVIFRAGLATVDPDASSGYLSKNANTTDISVSKVDADTQAGFSATLMITDSIGVELLAATPFSHTISTDGSLTTDLADVKHLPPTLSVQYYPLDSNSTFQPYMGVGVNYTYFYDEKFKAGNKALFDNLELDDSYGLTAQLGMDYRLDDHWSLNAAVWYMDISTEAKFTGVNNSDAYKIDVDIDPLVYMAGVAYQF